MESVTAPRVLTPAGFARVASRGRWTCPPHLDRLNRALLGVMAGRITRLMVSIPPRHGKSYLISHHFPAYYLGVFPEREFALCSYEADFAAEWGGKARDVLQEWGKPLFGVEVHPGMTSAARWACRPVGSRAPTGGMKTAGVGGPLTGRGAHMLVIDDPIKNSEEANSLARRNAIWDWYVTTARTRLEPGGAVVLVQTRWNADDLAGRIMEWAKQGEEPWTILNFPALAEENDPLGRAPGEALWPERYDRRYLEVTREQDSWAFASLYQGQPRPKGGGMFKEEWIRGRLVSASPPDCEWVRFWDFASSEGKGDWTAGPMMGRSSAGKYFLKNVVRGRWSTGRRDEVIRQTADTDADLVGQWSYRVRGELQPGAAGKDHAAAFMSLLEGFDVGVVPASGDKEIRARPFASQCEAGNVFFEVGDYLEPLIKELCLAEGTIITTNRGPIPIEQVVPGDLALTRDGWKEVYKRELTNESVEVTIIKADDHVVEGTAGHPVWVVGRGFVPMNSLEVGDRLLCLEDRERPSFITESHFTATQNRPIPPRVGTSRVGGMARRLTCTVSSTWRRLARFLTGLRSITGTRTHSITPSPTSNSSRAPSTERGITPSGCGPTSAGSAGSNSSLGLHKEPSTAPRSAGTPSGLSTARSGPSCVSGVGWISLPPRPVSDSVPGNVPRGPTGRRTGAGRSPVPSVPSLSCPTRQNRYAVRSVAVSLIAGGGEKRRVYNLGVAGSPEYFANGILVHNCDFPRGKHDDQVDGCSGAFNELAQRANSMSSPATGEDRADFLVGGL